jgi:hypothetical protein
MNGLHTGFGSMLLATAVAVLAQACGAPSSEIIGIALNATNVVFQPHTVPPIPLSNDQAETFKRIVARFRDHAQVRVTADIAYPAAFFACDGVRFGLLSGGISSRDPKKRRYYVVEDLRLRQIWQEYTNCLGDKLPLHSPSKEEWQKILSALK